MQKIYWSIIWTLLAKDLICIVCTNRTWREKIINTFNKTAAMMHAMLGATTLLENESNEMNCIILGKQIYDLQSLLRYTSSSFLASHTSPFISCMLLICLSHWLHMCLISASTQYPSLRGTLTMSYNQISSMKKIKLHRFSKSISS